MTVVAAMLLPGPAAEVAPDDVGPPLVLGGITPPVPVPLPTLWATVEATLGGAEVLAALAADMAAALVVTVTTPDAPVPLPAAHQPTALPPCLTTQTFLS